MVSDFYNWMENKRLCPISFGRRIQVKLQFLRTMSHFLIEAVPLENKNVKMLHYMSQSTDFRFCLMLIILSTKCLKSFFCFFVFCSLFVWESTFFKSWCSWLARKVQKSLFWIHKICPVTKEFSTCRKTKYQEFPDLRRFSICVWSKDYVCFVFQKCGKKYCKSCLRKYFDLSLTQIHVFGVKFGWIIFVLQFLYVRSRI